MTLHCELCVMVCLRCVCSMRDVWCACLRACVCLLFAFIFLPFDLEQCCSGFVVFWNHMNTPPPSSLWRGFTGSFISLSSEQHAGKAKEKKKEKKKGCRERRRGIGGGGGISKYKLKWKKKQREREMRRGQTQNSQRGCLRV